jgi:cell division protein FtsB
MKGLDVMKRKEKSLLLRLLVLGVSAYFIVSLSFLWADLIESKKKLEDYESQIAATEITINEYKALLTEGNEAKIIEKAARERLGYVFSDEQVYIDISGN